MLSLVGIWLSKELFEAVKQAVSQTPVLQYYDLDKEVTIQCDASSHGLSVALLQNGQPVAYASRALIDCETCFAQIEKEYIAILFACEHFYLYLYGRENIMVEMGHESLELIFKKSLQAAPIHLQKMRMHLHRYSIKVSTKKEVKCTLPTCWVEW